jgi:tetratricopeptide (TPR) repeat protein
MASRTRRYQLLYILAVLMLAALSLLAHLWAGIAGLAALAVVLLVPGRVGGYCLENLFRSRKLFTQGRFNEAIDAGKTFLADLERQPWRRHFVYCHYGFYTWDVEAMALNNIGAAQMELGDVEQAERSLRLALQKDPDYPLPCFNLAIVAYVRGDAAEGDRLVSMAAEKGYSGGAVDKAISRVGAAYAQLQARA